MLSLEEVYFALTLNWQFGREIKKRIIENRGPRNKRISSPEMYMRLSHLVDQQHAEERVIPLEIDDLEIKQHQYRLTKVGYNKRQDLLQRKQGFERGLAPA